MTRGSFSPFRPRRRRLHRRAAQTLPRRQTAIWRCSDSGPVAREGAQPRCSWLCRCVLWCFMVGCASRNVGSVQGRAHGQTDRPIRDRDHKIQSGRENGSSSSKSQKWSQVRWDVASVKSRCGTGNGAKARRGAAAAGRIEQGHRWGKANRPRD